MQIPVKEFNQELLKYYIFFFHLKTKQNCIPVLLEKQLSCLCIVGCDVPMRHTLIPLSDHVNKYI